MILLDTNVLIYASDINSSFHIASKSIRDKGIRGEVLLCITPQVLLEFFAVVTSQKRTANPIESFQALDEIEKYLKADKITTIYPNENTFLKLIELERKYCVKGQEIFDLQLIATMLSNNVKTIYTFNTDHFSKIDEIESLTPPIG
jgi:hypothetical protein